MANSRAETQSRREAAPWPKVRLDDELRTLGEEARRLEEAILGN